MRAASQDRASALPRKVWPGAANLQAMANILANKDRAHCLTGDGAGQNLASLREANWSRVEGWRRSLGLQCGLDQSGGGVWHGLIWPIREFHLCLTWLRIAPFLLMWPGRIKASNHRIQLRNNLSPHRCVCVIVGFNATKSGRFWTR